MAEAGDVAPAGGDDPEDMRMASLLGLVENLKCGATAVNQHHKVPGSTFADATRRPPE